MLVDLIVPATGESVTSAAIARWHQPTGAAVKAGETVATLETDKVSHELTAAVDGTLEIIVPEDQEVPVGTLIGRILTGADLTNPAPPAQPEPAPAAPDEGRETRRPLSRLRRKIATQLVNAQRNAAILTTFNEVDMSAIIRMRELAQSGFVAKHGVKLGFMSFFLKATVRALQQVPALASRIDGNDLVQSHRHDLGVAVQTERGLIVPVLRDCDRKSFAQLEQDLADYLERARAGTITLADLQGGVFTLSNGGVYGSLFSTPILNAPQSGLLGMHAIQDRPVAVDGRVVIRPMMYLALSYDHRVIDGRDAVSFLARLKADLEAPVRLLDV